MEHLKELYSELEQEALSKRNVDTKAGKIRVFVENLSEYLGRSCLIVEVTYDLFLMYNPTINVTKAYFKTILKKAWRLKTDENGIEWVVVEDLHRGR